jgi:hypothetical protein
MNTDSNAHNTSEGNEPNVRRWTDAELDELLGAHALDAVDDPEERAAIEAYVLRSPRARDELDSHRIVASALGNAVIQAPADLWGRIAAGLQTPAEIQPARTVVTKRRRPWALLSGAGRPSLSGGSTVATTRPWTVAAAAGLCVAVAASGFAINRSSELRSAKSISKNLRTDMAIERARSSQLREELNRLRTTSPLAIRIAQLEKDPSARNVQLVSTDGHSLGHVLLATDGEGYIVGDTLPTLAAGRTYQLWGVKGGAVLSLGVMGRSPKAMPFAADEQWSQLVLTDEASPGVVASKATAAAVAKLDQA